MKQLISGGQWLHLVSNSQWEPGGNMSTEVRITAESIKSSSNYSVILKPRDRPTFTVKENTRKQDLAWQWLLALGASCSIFSSKPPWLWQRTNTRLREWHLLFSEKSIHYFDNRHEAWWCWQSQRNEYKQDCRHERAKIIIFIIHKLSWFCHKDFTQTWRRVCL
jgi:hypothetical protein